MAKINLENIVRAGQNYIDSSTLFKNIIENPHNKANGYDFLTYAQRRSQVLKIKEKDIDETAGKLNRSPTKLRKIVQDSFERDEERLKKIISRDYKQIIEDMPEEAVKTLAAEIPKDNAFYKIAKKLQAGDLEGAREIYAETFENEVLKNFIKIADMEFIAPRMEVYVEFQKNRFVNEYSKETEKEGKKVRGIDYNKLREYVKNSVKDYKDENDRKEAYLLAGQIYARAKLPEYQKKIEDYKAARKKYADKNYRRTYRRAA